MEIIRIPSTYRTQIQYLSDEDISYIFKNLFLLWEWEVIDVEDSMRWWLLKSIWREVIQMENKARAKKWEKRLSYELATLRADTVSNVKTKKSATKSKQVKASQSNTNIDSKESKELALNKKTEIDEIQEAIKNEVLSRWLIYKKWKQERNRIQNILTGKEFGQVCELSRMSRIDFCINIIRVSVKLSFWNWKIYNAETLYKHYASVYNEAKRMKSESELSNKNKVWITTI